MAGVLWLLPCFCTNATHFGIPNEHVFPTLSHFSGRTSHGIYIANSFPALGFPMNLTPFRFYSQKWKHLSGHIFEATVNNVNVNNVTWIEWDSSGKWMRESQLTTQWQVIFLGGICYLSGEKLVTSPWVLIFNWNCLGRVLGSTLLITSHGKTWKLLEYECWNHE